MRIVLPLLALVVGATAGSVDSKAVISETTILNRIITSLKVFDETLGAYKGGPTEKLKAAASDLAYTLESQTVIAHEIGSLSFNEAQALKGKSEELHAASGRFLKDFAAAKGKLDKIGASPKVYYYLTFKLSKSFSHSRLSQTCASTIYPTTPCPWPPPPCRHHD